METMKEWFGLTGEHRDFTIDYTEDAELFFARQELDDQLLALLRRSFRTDNPPKLVLYGEWGTGKTHTMRHIQYLIETGDEFNATVVFVELPDILGKSTFQVAHGALLDALGIDKAKEWAINFQSTHGASAHEKIQEITQSSDIAIAFTSLPSHGDLSRIAWDWLRGLPLSAADARMAGLPPSLSQSTQFIRVLEMLGQLCKLSDDYMLVLMLDEATKLDSITNSDANSHWVNSFKLLADSQTKDVGFIVSGSWIHPDDMALPLQDSQVMGRFGEHNYIRLPNLDADQTQDFISALLNALIDPAKRTELIDSHGTEAEGEDIDADTFPFTKPGLDLAVQYVCRHGGYTTPREIQQTLDDLLNRAIDSGKHIVSSPYMQAEVGG